MDSDTESDTESYVDVPTRSRRGVEQSQCSHSKCYRAKTRRGCGKCKSQKRTTKKGSKEKKASKKKQTSTGSKSLPQTFVYKYFLNTVRQMLIRMGENLSESEVRELARTVWSRLTDRQKKVVAQDAKESRKLSKCKTPVANNKQSGIEKKCEQGIKRRSCDDGQVSKKKTSRQPNANEPGKKGREQKKNEGESKTHKDDKNVEPGNDSKKGGRSGNAANENKKE